MLDQKNEPLLTDIERKEGEGERGGSDQMEKKRRHSLLSILVRPAVSRRLTAVCCGKAAN
jgi:hypothetical protein